MNDRRCLKCDEQLKGRADQKFCSDQCRSAYNNLQYVELNNVIKTVNRILKKNHLILATLNSEGKVTATKSDLQKKGYRFEYFTSTYTTRSNRINYFCYDQGFRLQESDKLVLIQRNISQDLALH